MTADGSQTSTFDTQRDLGHIRISGMSITMNQYGLVVKLGENLWPQTHGVARRPGSQDTRCRLNTHVDTTGECCDYRLLPDKQPKSVGKLFQLRLEFQYNIRSP